MSDTMSIEQRMARFTPRELGFDAEALSPATRRALPHLVAAMRGMDELYHRQLGAEVPALMRERAGGDDLLARALRHFNGPWDTLDGHAPFVEGVGAPLPGKALYPADLGREELEAWIAAHPDDRAALLDPTTVVRREGDRLVAVPYAEVYRDELERVAAELRAAADLVDHAGLAEFLRGRAAALLGEKPLAESDADWVRLTDAPLEVVIGPFEVYADGLMGIKAFYEGMLLAVDHEAGARLRTIEANLADLATLVPLPAGSKGALGEGARIAPMVIADEVIATGDGFAGILASAFNLPNDPAVRSEVGWKQVMIRNVMRAKFEACTAPIAGRVLRPEQAGDLSFDAYFYFVLLHEVSHSLGPMYRADGRSTNEACGRHYSALEEAKADTGALVLLLARNGRHGIPALDPARIGASYLAGIYRSARFGLHEAHGQANVIQYAWFRRHGAFTGEGRLAVDAERLREAAAGLLDRLCTLQAAGSPDEIEAFLADYGAPPDDLVTAIRALDDLPIDIAPIFPAV